MNNSILYVELREAQLIRMMLWFK